VIEEANYEAQQTAADGPPIAFRVGRYTGDPTPRRKQADCFFASFLSAEFFRFI
jgi:hypothetical protein